MKQKLKLHPNTILILCILGVAFIMNLGLMISNSRPSDVDAINKYRELILPVNVADFLKAVLILVIGWLIFKIVKNVLHKENWSQKYYRNIKRIGWLSVLALLFDSFSAGAKSQIYFRDASLTNERLYINALTDALFNSPIAWLLVLCIFLLADVLDYAMGVKKENESFI